MKTIEEIKEKFTESENPEICRNYTEAVIKGIWLFDTQMYDYEVSVFEAAAEKDYSETIINDLKSKINNRYIRIELLADIMKMSKEAYN